MNAMRTRMTLAAVLAALALISAIAIPITTSDAAVPLNEGYASGDGIVVEYVDSSTSGYGLITVTFDAYSYGNTFFVILDGDRSADMVLNPSLINQFLVPGLSLGNHSLMVCTDSKEWNLNLLVERPTMVESVYLDITEKTISRGDSFTLVATVMPADAFDKTVSWSSSDKSVATVDKNGNVLGVGLGEATITVTTNDASKTATCVVTVVPPTVTSVALELDSVELGLKQSMTLNVEVIPEDSSDISVTWSSSNAKVVSVDKYGNITGLKEGTAVITVKSNANPDAFDTCTVTVRDLSVKSVSVEPAKITLIIGDKVALSAIITPDYAANKDVTWKSSKDAVATVDADGNVEAISKGSATITVTTVDGKKTAKCAVTVIEQPAEWINILNDEPIELPLNNSMTIGYEVGPEDAVNKNVKWTSSNTKVVSVDKNGTIKALKTGTATITVTSAADKNVFATCEITVKIVELTSISMDATKDMTVGDKETLEVVFDPEDASYRTLTWSSDNTKVATVDKNGNVTAKAYGTAIITATAANGTTAECTVSVDNVHPDSVVLDKHELSIKAGSTATLKATVNPKNAFDKTVIWGSDDEDIATVDQKGKITAKAFGTVTITVTTNDPVQLTDTCTVSVEDVPIKSVTLPKTLTIYTNGSSQLVPKISPVLTVDMEWASDDESIVTVVDNGVITSPGLKTGTTVVRLTAFNTVSTVSAQCEVTVKHIPVTGVTISETKKELYNGDSFDLVATIIPDDAGNKNVTWKSSKEAVATVDENGHVEAISKGSATITVTTEDGKKTAKCNVTVKPIPVTGVTLEDENISLSLNNTCTVDYAIEPGNAADKTVTWKSSNTKVASVDKNGVIKGVGVGNAVITVTTKDGKYTDTCNVSVYVVPLDSVTIDSTLTVMVKEKIQLMPVFAPDEASYKDVTWASEDKKIASVDKNGNVTGVKEGTVKITVTSKEGKTSECDVTVIPAEIRSITLSKEYVVLDVKKTASITAKYVMSNAVNDIVWSSDNSEIATVDAKGKITAVSEGVTTIKATSQATGVFAECTVYVKTVSVKSVAIYDGDLKVTKLALGVGDDRDLEAVIVPDNATYDDVIWSSSNTDVVDVDEKGHITVLKAGTAKITVTTLDGNKKATCTVTVS